MPPTKRCLAAARLANCDEFAEKLPEGWHTRIGENGSQLSGGERQRVSIARAFLKNAPILLLDEATASLDVDNETLIQTALSRLIQGRTVLVIAHRMRTVAGADKIVVRRRRGGGRGGQPPRPAPPGRKVCPHGSPADRQPDLDASRARPGNGPPLTSTQGKNGRARSKGPAVLLGKERAPSYRALALAGTLGGKE